MKLIKLAGVFLAVSCLVLAFQNCGKSSVGKPLSVLSSEVTCSTDQVLNVPLGVNAIDQSFPEIAGITVQPSVVDSNCPNIEKGVQAATFEGSVRREDGVLFVRTNLTRKNGNPFDLSFYKNTGFALPKTIDKFCESNTSLVTLVASGAFDKERELLKIDLSFNRIAVAACPQTGVAPAAENP